MIPSGLQVMKLIHNLIDFFLAIADVEVKQKKKRKTLTSDDGDFFENDKKFSDKENDVTGIFYKIVFLYIDSKSKKSKKDSKANKEKSNVNYIY
jgi:hypothetical protein